MRKYGVACVARIESLVAPLVEEDCMKRSLIVALIFFGSFVGRLESQNVPPEVISYPETILHGGKIVTMSDNPAIAEAVAIREGKILAVGPAAEVLRLAGPKTVTINLQGKSVLPGLIDTHSHPHEYSLDSYASDAVAELRMKTVTGNSFQDFLSGIESLAAKAKPDEWMMIRLEPADLANDFWLKHTYRDLDKVAQDKLVFINQGTRGLMTSKGLERLKNRYGFESELLRLPGLLDKDGQITGRFRAEVIRVIQTDLMMDGKKQLLKESYFKIFNDLAKFGITTWSSTIQPLQAFEALSQLDREKRMTVRLGYSHAQGFTSFPNARGFYERLGAVQGHGTDFLWAIGASPGNSDGSYPNVCTSIEARPTIKEREQCFTSPQDFKREGIEAIVQSGNRVTGLHIAGDRALDQLMDAIEDASEKAGFTAEEIRQKRHTTDHCTINPRPDQIQRLKKLGMIVSCAPKYIEDAAPRILRDYGEEYLKWNVPVKSMIDAGVKPVVELDSRLRADKNAFYHVQMLVTREAAGRTWNVQERIDRVTALKMFTRWAAEYVLRENELGSIERGKWADLIVLDRDYMTIPENELNKTQVLLTMVGGRIVHKAANF
jgi:predicted amidohydrolase YtcJ